MCRYGGLKLLISWRVEGSPAVSKRGMYNTMDVKGCLKSVCVGRYCVDFIYIQFYWNEFFSLFALSVLCMVLP